MISHLKIWLNKLSLGLSWDNLFEHPYDWIQRVYECCVNQFVKDVQRVGQPTKTRPDIRQISAHLEGWVFGRKAIINDANNNLKSKTRPGFPVGFWAQYIFIL